MADTEKGVLGDLLGGEEPPGEAPETGSDMRLESAQGVLDAIKAGDAQALLDALDMLMPPGMGSMMED